MTPEDLISNAVLDIMHIRITKIEVSKGTIQYWYTAHEQKFFIRINKDRFIVGKIDQEDDESYATGLPNDVIIYLINNFKKVIL